MKLGLAVAADLDDRDAQREPANAPLELGDVAFAHSSIALESLQVLTHREQAASDRFLAAPPPINIVVSG